MAMLVVITTAILPSPRRFSLALLLWLAGCAGLCGLHRLYCRRWGTGVLYLATFGLFGVGQITDWVRLGGMVRRANAPRRPVRV